MEIVVYPHPILKDNCSDVTVFDDKLRQLIDSMAEAMYSSGGVGLAAPQVGLSKKIILIDQSAGESGNELISLINPKIVAISTEFNSSQEGCLSLPGISVTVTRPTSCDIEYVDVDGKVKSINCSGFKARIVQHEIDHLYGITLLDKMGSLYRRMALKNLTSAQ